MTDSPNASAWKDPAVWGRVVFALLYLLILALVVGPLVIMLGLVQGVFTIATGEDNRNLRDLGAALAGYVHEILLFVTWNREQKPFPFSEFPRTGGDAAGQAAAEPAGDKAGQPQARETVAADEENESDATGDGAPESGGAEEKSAELGEAGEPAGKSVRKKKTGSRKSATDDYASGD